MTFALTVPGTDTELTEHGNQLIAADHTFGFVIDGIWDLVRPERRSALDQFAADYAAVRTAESRELTVGEVQTLPQVRPDHPLADMWQQRAASYDRFTKAIATASVGHLVDIGAGCAWLAADMARNGWQAAAVDVTVEGGDGLAAGRYHSADVLLARAEMEALPFASDSLDLAVFNAALHYAGNISAALAEAMRVVRPGGLVAVLDSPVFADPAAGHAMVTEFGDHVQQTLGLPAAAHEGPGFVTDADLAGIDFTSSEQTTGLRQRVHQWRGARRAGRETARRPLLITTIGENA